MVLLLGSAVSLHQYHSVLITIVHDKSKIAARASPLPSCSLYEYVLIILGILISLNLKFGSSISKKHLRFCLAFTEPLD